MSSKRKLLGRFNLRSKYQSPAPTSPSISNPQLIAAARTNNTAFGRALYTFPGQLSDGKRHDFANTNSGVPIENQPRAQP
ncbi:hypothetical protein ST47_g78 [Ascochyta rabiei]|uniref:Uncharacterized protein n=1 Tax=Didymella rabiei TaxID=5454 RepID=A0A163MK88_DIDRA|nr:hypothetical protein ST47_g78 [Ascochyta rabiei]